MSPTKTQREILERMADGARLYDIASHSRLSKNGRWLRGVMVFPSDARTMREAGWVKAGEITDLGRTCLADQARTTGARGTDEQGRRVV